MRTEIDPECSNLQYSDMRAAEWSMAELFLQAPLHSPGRRSVYMDLPKYPVAVSEVVLLSHLSGSTLSQGRPREPPGPHLTQEEACDPWRSRSNRRHFDITHELTLLCRLLCLPRTLEHFDLANLQRSVMWRINRVKSGRTKLCLYIVTFILLFFCRIHSANTVINVAPLVYFVSETLQFQQRSPNTSIRENIAKNVMPMYNYSAALKR